MRHILQAIQIRPGTREITPCARTYRPQRCHISLLGRTGAGRDSQRGWRNILWHYVPVAFPLTTPFFILSSLPSVTPHHKSSPGRGVTDCPSAVAANWGLSVSGQLLPRARAGHTERDGVARQGGLPGSCTWAEVLATTNPARSPGAPCTPVRPKMNRPRLRVVAFSGSFSWLASPAPLRRRQSERRDRTGRTRTDERDCKKKVERKPPERPIQPRENEG